MNIWVNGCFDILHGGHLDLLEYAKNLDNLENYLVVGIDSDERVKLLKGSGRPINHESFRKRILESLEFVDEVVIFGSEKELETIIKRHDIDYIIVGDHYKNKRVVGAEYAKFGVEFFKTDDRSTTAIINKLKNNI